MLKERIEVSSIARSLRDALRLRLRLLETAGRGGAAWPTPSCLG